MQKVLTGDDVANTTRHLPLSGLVVLDLTIVRAGPTCVRHLADWGADVIRIEPPSETGEPLIGSRDSPDFENLHRNKRAMYLNLKDPAGYAAFMKMVERADVIVENMRAPVKHRLKIAWEDVHKVNPRLVYGSISGFGQDGPYAGRAGVDQIVQGMGGLMSITGMPGQGPVRVGIAISDLTAGNLLALGIMMALYERERTGVGRWVQTSLLEAQIFMLDFQAARYLMKGEVAGQAGNDHPTSAPSGVLETANGHINLSATSGQQWATLCDTLGHPEWKQKPEWKTAADRWSDKANLIEAIATETRKQSTEHWVDLFDGLGLPCGPIYAIDKMFDDPQVRHLGMAAPIDHPKQGPTAMVASPLGFSGLPREIRQPTAPGGTHTDEVLGWLGYSSSEIDDLRRNRVI